MKGSLQRQLSVTLAGVIVASGVAAAIVSFFLGYTEAQEFQDDALRQVSALAPAASAGEGESAIQVIRIASHARPAWLPADAAPGLHTFEGRERMRAFVRVLPGGERLVVAQATDVRDELALNSALRTLVPLLLLLPLLVWLAMRVVARRLAPVRSLAQRLDAQSGDSLAALPAANVPDEIASFIHAINRLLERVSSLVGEQRRFVADAAHELRSPLAALLLQAQNVEAARSPDESRGRMAALRSGIERASRLAEQLLNLAKTQAGAAPAVRVDLAQFVRGLISEFIPLAKVRGIDLGMDTARPSVHVRAMPEPLTMIVGNALDNAIRYTPPGGRVTVRIAAEEDDAIIEVIDTGPGIPASERDRVFHAFHRGRASSGEGGGLGLAIARDAAVRLAGTVSLHDAEGHAGLLFRYRQRRDE